MRPHPSRHAEPSWLVNAQREHARKVAEAMPSGNGALRKSAKQAQEWKVAQRALIEAERPTCPPRRRKPCTRYVLAGFVVMILAVLLHWPFWAGLLGLTLVAIGGFRQVDSLLNSAAPQPYRVVSIGRGERDSVPARSGAHYHDDELCWCGQPDPCCDMGRVAWPHPCPWHPAEETA